jgi:hypothetical protein
MEGDIRNSLHLSVSVILTPSLLKPLEVVESAKLLGLTITSNLSWNAHLNDIIKRVSKRIYFLIQLKSANVACDDLKTFYIACIISVLDYVVPVFPGSLPNYLMKNELCQSFLILSTKWL